MLLRPFSCYFLGYFLFLFVFKSGVCVCACVRVCLDIDVCKHWHTAYSHWHTDARLSTLTLTQTDTLTHTCWHRGPRWSLARPEQAEKRALNRSVLWFATPSVLGQCAWHNTHVIICISSSFVTPFPLALRITVYFLSHFLIVRFNWKCVSVFKLWIFLVCFLTNCVIIIIIIIIIM